MKERASETAEDMFALLFPGLPEGVRERVVREWAQEDVGPAYDQRELPPPLWVERGGMNPEECRVMRRAERIRSVGASEGELCVLRAAVITRSTHASQQKIANQIGVNAATLHRFRRGRVPNPFTLAKLEDWYRQAVFAGELQLVGEPGALLVLKPILRTVPREERRIAAIELVDDMRRWHLTRGLPVPKWMDAAMRQECSGCLNH